MGLEQDIPSYRTCGVSFSTYSSEEVKKLSVKEITNPNAFDALLHPTYSGLYDPALGPVERNDACATCGLGSLMCPGHMGHITLPLPVYNPVLFKTMTQILKLSCFHCKRLRTKPGAMEVLISQLKLLDHGYISEVQQLDAIYSDILLAQGGEDATQQPLQTQLHQFMQSTLAGGDQSAMCKEFYIRNVTDYKQMLVRDFLAGKKYVKGQKCTHCKAMNRQLRTELGLKIFFQGGKKKPPRRPIPRLPPIAKRKSVENEENIDPEYVEMDNEETEKNRETQKAVHEDQSYLTQIAVRAHLREVWKTDGQVLGHILGLLNIKLQDPQGFPTDIFFLDVIPVPPSRFRPLSVMGDMKIENPQSANLGKVLKASYVLTEVLSEKKKAELSQTNEGDPDRSALLDEVMGDNVTEKLQNAWNRLQTHVNGLVDSDQDKMTPLNEKKPGIKQLIEKKEGLFRKHMMGKRVNYAARSVISPDPYINTNETGIPDIFAKKLTYPEPVTPFNFQELKQAVMNGPQVHPGATLVQNEDGTIVRLNASNATQREAIAKQLLTPSSSLLAPMGSKIVHRHLRNGDVLLLNRQPTLHRPSIQAHKARVLTGERTLRLHYANCKAYNADFDGDEMNAHFPQSERARAEAYCIACTDYQYLVPKDGSPLAGLIQDHMVAGVMLTLRGRFFTREEYQQLVFSALTDKRGRVTLLWPTILKPAVCWSGKQVLSTVLLNIIPKGKVPLNLKGKAKISSKQWVTGGRSRAWEAGGTPLVEDDMSESEVVIRGGELLVGVLDKGHYGATPYGLVHSCYELYGGEVAGMLLTCLAKLFTSFLQQVRGFSLGVEDILCTRKADLDRRQAMKTSDQHGLIASARVMGVGDPQDVGHLEACLQAAQFSKDGGDMKDLDLAMKSATDDVQNKISKACIPHGLEKPFPHNNLQLMVQAGAKGSMVNCMQISCLLGQIELEGRRPPLMMSGQSLPSFMPYDTSPRAGGFVDGRFLTGIRPQEYFFHCMAGREGLIDTAVKTSRSGYLQRCLIKHLEGLVISYDMSVRDSDGSVVQFLYGEDGLEITKTPFLKENQFEFLISNKEAVVSTEQMEEAQQHMNCDRAPSLHRALKKWKKKKKKKKSERRGSGFLTFCQKKSASVIEDWPVTSMDNSGRSKASTQLIHRWNNLEADKKHKYTNHSDRCPDPVLSQLSPVRYLGCVSEKFEEIIDNYMMKDPCQLLSEKDDNQGVGAGISEDRFRSLLYLRSAMALGQPGEAVGLVAAQSIGEPSTQMTLNTFHFAGRGEMNVTLGIPRLREILMVASANIKTPSMDIPVSPKLQDFSKAEKLKLKLNKACLSEVLEDIEVKEVVSVRQPGHKCRLYKIRFSFLPPEYYREQFLLTPSKILNHMELRFLPRFADAIKKKMLEMEKSSLLNHGTTQQRERRVAQQADGEQDDDMSDDDQHDGDATATRSRQRQQEDQDYQGEEEEREEIGVEEEDDEESDNDNVAEEVQEGEGGSEAEESDPESSRSTTPVSTPASQRKAKKKAAKKDQARISRVVHTVANMVDYDYDAQSELWCKVTFKVALSTTKVDMMSLIEAEAKKATVHHTPCINRGFLVLGKGQSQPDTMLKTEGVNIQEMYKHDTILDLNRLYTNDIHAMAQQYGIEAACRVIIKEIRDVFAAYGIGVDYRHLSLVADYMTFEGVYKAFNRAGLESNPSPLQKMTFETTMNFLKSATIMGAKDELKSPSAKLVVGRLVGGGTGCFSLIQPLR